MGGTLITFRDNRLLLILAYPDRVVSQKEELLSGQAHLARSKILPRLPLPLIFGQGSTLSRGEKIDESTIHPAYPTIGGVYR